MPWQLGPMTRTPLSLAARFQLGFQRAAGRAGFAEAGGQYHGGADAGLAAVADGLGYARRRHGYHRQVARRVDGGHMRIAGEAVHLRILGIDGKDTTPVAGRLQRLDRMAADAAQVSRCADDGDAAWMEQGIEAQGGGAPASTK
jgi:hypothetical protein